MNDQALTIRFAERKDLPLIVKFIKQQAKHHQSLDEVEVTAAVLEEALFSDPPHVQVLIAEVGQQALGFASFFSNFSTFLGRPGLYVEDLFVFPEARGKGVGRALLRYLANLAIEKGYRRLEWVVSDWNVDSIEFYEKNGAIAKHEWIVYRVEQEALTELAESAYTDRK